MTELCFKVVIAYIAGELNFLNFNNLLFFSCFFFAFFAFKTEFAVIHYATHGRFRLVCYHNKVAAAVTAVAEARGAEGLVCGLPKNMDGTEGSRVNKSRRFAQRLANTANLPVVLWDERRTTVSAAAILADNDTFGAKRKERLDSVSAAVILESFLNWRAHHPDEEPTEMLRPQPVEH